MTLAWIVLLPFIGALLPGLLIRAGRDACALATGAVTLLALILLLTPAPAVFAGEVVEARWEWLPVLGLNVTFFVDGLGFRSEEHTSELQSLMRISYAVFCL